ncbi:MAG TPA: serine/threonine-protein kinase [Polyangiaceae bacterium]|nr:serine/threonine-protein kinase [Polyangiaceae bacterium]
MAEKRPGLSGYDEDRDSRLGVILADRYRIDSLLDRGAMGRVYAGEHVLMKKRVAIKVLHRELTMVPEFVARFEREAMAAANIESEHVVAATDFGKLPDGAVFLVLEFIEGKNLRDEMSPGPMPLVRALHITRQIAVALRSAHALGIVHRDLKPENVMLVDKAGDPDFVKVLDFGIAKVPIGEPTEDDGPKSKPITKAGMVFGTPEYMPPEQALGQNVDARADLYSLGIMLYEMLAGTRPFVAKSQVGILGQQIAEPVPPVSKRAPGVTLPAAVERFLAKLLEREPADRFQTAQEVLQALDKHLGYGPGRERIPTLRQGTLPSTNPPPPTRAGDDDLPTNRISIPGVSHPLEAAKDWVDARRSKLPPALRAVPAPVLFSVPLALVGITLGFLLVGRSGPKPEAPATTASARVEPAEKPATAAEAPARAPDGEIAQAASGGTMALVALESRYPKDPAVFLAEAAARSKEKDAAGSVRAIRDALALDPAVKNDSQVASALFMAAQNKKSSSAAFALLSGPMGDRGTQILRDLTTTAGVREPVRAAARRALAGRK